MRAVLELAGIHDILSKSLGSQNPINLVKATVAGLQGLRRPEEVAELRGLSIDQVLGVTDKRIERAAEAEAAAEAAADRRRRRPPTREARRAEAESAPAAAPAEAAGREHLRGDPVQVEQRRQPAPARHAALARPAPHRPHASRSRTPPRRAACSTRVRHLVSVEEKPS